MNVALYTAVYGDYNQTVWPANVSCPAYYFTDSETKAKEAESKGWIPRIVRHSVTTFNGTVKIVEPMMNHKWWKCHPELACPGVDVSLWVDGRMEIIDPDYVGRCIRELGEDDWACMPHPERICIYPEAELSASLVWRYDPPSINTQAAHYRSLGHPDNWDLVATGRNARRHTPEVLELSKQWWYECLTWSHQDQLSLPVLFRGSGIRYNKNLPWFNGGIILHEHGE